MDRYGSFSVPLALVVIVSAAVIIVTTGESFAVRYLTGLVALDVAARLVLSDRRRHSAAG